MNDKYTFSLCNFSTSIYYLKMIQQPSNSKVTESLNLYLFTCDNSQRLIRLPTLTMDLHLKMNNKTTSTTTATTLKEKGVLVSTVIQTVYRYKVDQYKRM